MNGSVPAGGIEHWLVNADPVTVPPTTVVIVDVPGTGLVRSHRSTSICAKPLVTPDAHVHAVEVASRMPPADHVALVSARRLNVYVGVVADTAPACTSARNFAVLVWSPSLSIHCAKSGSLHSGMPFIRLSSVVNVAKAVLATPEE